MWGRHVQNLLASMLWPVTESAEDDADRLHAALLRNVALHAVEVCDVARIAGRRTVSLAITGPTAVSRNMPYGRRDGVDRLTLQRDGDHI